MKLKAGITKGRDLLFGRENNLRILNRVFDIVLFQILEATIRRRCRDFQTNAGITRAVPLAPTARNTPAPYSLLFDQRDEFFIIFHLHLLQRNETKRG